MKFLTFLFALLMLPRTRKRAVRILNLRMLGAAELRGLGQSTLATRAERVAYETYLDEIGLGRRKVSRGPVRIP